MPTIAEASRLFAARKLSPVELTRACIGRREKLDPALNAFILATPDRALAEAKAAEARILAGAPRSRIDGIPIAHKDIYGTAGLPTTAHSRLLEGWVPAEDATTVAMWARAGTVMMGKLATHEFAFGGPSFDLPWPPARNPWNREHFTSGSSSGTGAAVASGMILGGTGSDTGGSIRGPASLCGVAGIKPTYGLCSRYGILPLSYSLDHAGPLAWTVEDCALLLQAMAGYDPLDPAGANRPVPDMLGGLRTGVRGLRVGIVRNFHEVDNKVSAEVQAGIDAAAAALREDGAVLSDVTLPSLQDFYACGFVVMVAEAYALHEKWMRSEFNSYGEMLRDRMALGGLMSAADYVQALRRRRELCVATAAAMADVDVLLTTAAPGEAPRIADVPKWTFDTPSLTMPFNVTGLPAMVVCSGFGAGGLPLGVQIAGKPFAEPTVFRAAYAVERAIGNRGRRPAPA